MGDEPSIDGVALGRMAWVRATDGSDFSFTNGKLQMVSPRSSETDAKAMTRAIATGGGNPVENADSNAVVNFRNTTHGALNHHVEEHAYGSWEKQQMVVVAPFKSMVRENGAPTGFSTVDTYWASRPDGGLKVPDAIVVMPGDKSNIAAGATSAFGTSNIFYRVDGFDQVSEHGLRQAHTKSWEERVSADVVRQGAAQGRSFGDHELQLDRSSRTPGYNEILDNHLAHAAKKMATDLAIERIGPVRTGATHGWKMPSSGEGAMTETG